MGDELSPVPAETSATAECKADEPGPKAVEALVWAIAQEFVGTVDEFCDALLADDENDQAVKVRTAGS